MIRRLTHADDDLLREAYRWDADRPKWFREMDAVFSRGSEDDFIRLLDDPRNVLISVWSDCLEAVIIVTLIDYGLFESHLCARRGANMEVIVNAAHTLLHDLVQFDLQELYVWVAEKHRSVKRLCSMIGFHSDGARMYKGTYRGRLITWNRYSIRRADLAIAKAA
jgi:hypothetical protein